MKILNIFSTDGAGELFVKNMMSSHPEILSTHDVNISGLFPYLDELISNKLLTSAEIKSHLKTIYEELNPDNKIIIQSLQHPKHLKLMTTYMKVPSKYLFVSRDILSTNAVFLPYTKGNRKQAYFNFTKKSELASIYDTMLAKIPSSKRETIDFEQLINDSAVAYSQVAKLLGLRDANYNNSQVATPIDFRDLRSKELRLTKNTIRVDKRGVYGNTFIDRCVNHKKGDSDD